MCNNIITDPYRAKWSLWNHQKITLYSTCIMLYNLTLIIYWQWDFHIMYQYFMVKAIKVVPWIGMIQKVHVWRHEGICKAICGQFFSSRWGYFSCDKKSVITHRHCRRILPNKHPIRLCDFTRISLIVPYNNNKYCMCNNEEIENEAACSIEL